MANKNIDLLIKRIRNSVEGDEGERFCFILGSGASKGSGIPSGSELEYEWMEELLGDPSADGYEVNLREVKPKAEELRERRRIEHSFDDIVKHWEEQKRKNEKSLNPEFYFDIFELHEFFTQKDGQRDIERRFEKKKEEIAPSYGYAVLAKLLAYKGRNDIVITTNFDNLVEQALSLTQVSPIVVNHEALAAVIGGLVPDCRYPIIGKIHRGIGYGIKNSNEETGELPKAWENALDAIFRFYTPIVIGYSGNDKSLMSYLKNHTYPRGIIWCIYENDQENDLKNDHINKAVNNSHRGYFVIHNGFDSLMANIGEEIFGEEIEIKNETSVLNKWRDKYASKLENTYRNVMSDAVDENPSGGTDKGNAKRGEKNAPTARNYFRRAYDLVEQRDYNGAIDNYAKAIELDPKYAKAYNNRGNAYKNIGELDKAIADYDKAIELDPKYAKAYNNRGNTYDDMGEYDKAIADYNKAIELDPKYAAAYNNRGVAYEEQGKLREALADYDKALELKPNLTETKANRDRVLALLREEKQ